MGKVKTEQIKRVAKELLERFPAKFSNNFDNNKRKVQVLTIGTTVRVRNQIAGYITRTLSLAESESSSEDMEEVEEFSD